MNEGSDARTIRSVYQGEMPFSDHLLPACHTVGDLAHVLSALPSDLPIRVSMFDGVKPVWFNIGQDSEHLGLEENDGTWDEPQSKQ